MRQHRGPVNLSSISTRNPNDLITDIQKILQQIGVSQKNMGNFSLKCEYNDLKFMVEINTVEMYNNIYVIKLYKTNQTSGNYFELCQNIFQKLVM